MTETAIVLPDTLGALVADDARRQAVVQDAADLVAAEVQKQRGPVGFVVRQAYKVVQALEGGRLIHNAIGLMLDDFIAALEPFYQQYRALPAADRPPFDQYLLAQPDVVTAALLGVTDRRRQRVNNRVLTAAYDQLRPLAERHVRAALPGIAALVARRLPA